MLQRLVASGPRRDLRYFIRSGIRTPLGITALATVLIACADRDDAAPPVDAAPAQPPAVGAAQTAADPSAVTAEFAPIDDSGVEGTAHIEPDGQQVRITVTLRTAGAGTHRGHVHSGTCASRGRSVFELEPIVTDASGTGEALSTVDLPASALMDGQHIIVYHAAGGSPGPSVVCADIPVRG